MLSAAVLAAVRTGDGPAVVRLAVAAPALRLCGLLAPGRPAGRPLARGKGGPAARHGRTLDWDPDRPSR